MPDAVLEIDKGWGFCCPLFLLLVLTPAKCVCVSTLPTSPAPAVFVPERWGTADQSRWRMTVLRNVHCNSATSSNNTKNELIEIRAPGWVFPLSNLRILNNTRVELMTRKLWSLWKLGVGRFERDFKHKTSAYASIRNDSISRNWNLSHPTWLQACLALV